MSFLTGAELERWTGGGWEPSVPAGVEGVSTDTRALSRGSLYVALKGPRFDGHDFLGKAFAAGAAAVAAENGARFPASPERPVLRVPDTLAALRDMAAGYRASLEMKTVGVTGSVGKTTVKELIACVLNAAGPAARTPGNWNNEIGLSLSLLAADRGVGAGVFEVGTNHPGEIAPLCRMLRPSYGVVTNIGPVHLEHFGSLDAVASEKGELLRILPAEGAAILLREDAYFGELKDMTRARVVTVSMLEDADFRCAARKPAENLAVIKERDGGAEYELRVPLPGAHGVRNAMFAVAVGRLFGVGVEAIREGIGGYKALPMRWAVEEVRGVTVIDDSYNANPMSMAAAMETFAALESKGGKWLVLGDMLEIGRTEREEHEKIGRLAATGNWAGLAVVGDRGAWIADAAAAEGFDPDRIVRCATSEEAGRALAGRVRGGDCMLLKGSRGMGLERVKEAYAVLSV